MKSARTNTGDRAHLLRQIGLGSGIAVVVGSTIGSGIFRSPSGIAEKLPSPTIMLAVWVVGGLFALCGALTLAEVGGALPYSGGLYVYLREAYGRVVGFLFGWAQLVLIRPASTGAVAVVFGQYALRLGGATDGSAGFDQKAAALAILAIMVVTVANVVGVRFGVGIQNLTTIAKTGGLLVLIVLAFALGLPKSGGHFSATSSTGGISISMFGLALVSVLWAYDGWADGSYVGGEMVNARKNLPRSIILGTLAVIGVYLLANFAYLSVLSVEQISKSSQIAADVMSSLVGGWGVVFIVATVMISTLGTLNGSVLTSPRIFFALAEDKMFFDWLGIVHPRFKTPYAAVIMTGVLGISYVLVATVLSGSKAFSSLTDAFVIGMVPFYALSVGSVFVFRRRESLRIGTSAEESDDSLVDAISAGETTSHPHTYSPPVRTPLYPVVPLLFVCSTVYLLLNSLMDAGSRIPTLVTLGIVLLGMPVFYAVIARRAN